MSKSDPRIAAMGDVDELNSAIGVLLALGVSSDPSLAIDALLGEVQQDLLDLGGELSIPDYALLKVVRVAALDDWLARANATLPRLQEFIRPVALCVRRRRTSVAPSAVVPSGQSLRSAKLSRSSLQRAST